MPYASHESFVTPPPESQLWRYMDLAKFVALLETQSLFFASATQLGDPFEGLYSARNIDRTHIIWPSVPPAEWGKMNDQIAQMRVNLKATRHHFCVSCWYESPTESDAMWKLYSQAGAGIAIQTTCGSLCKSLASQPGDVYVGRVSYIDYKRDFVPEGNIFGPFLHKRLAFQHEREVRALVWVRDTPAEKATERDSSGGVSIRVDLNILLKQVVVSPLSPQWFHKLVDSILNRYSFSLPARHSDLADPAPY
jgi:hypothetical protein